MFEQLNIWYIFQVWSPVIHQKAYNKSKYFLILICLSKKKKNPRSYLIIHSGVLSKSSGVIILVSLATLAAQYAPLKYTKSKNNTWEKDIVPRSMNITCFWTLVLCVNGCLRKIHQDLVPADSKPFDLIKLVLMSSQNIVNKYNVINISIPKTSLNGHKDLIHNRCEC